MIWYSSLESRDLHFLKMLAAPFAESTLPVQSGSAGLLLTSNLNSSDAARTTLNTSQHPPSLWAAPGDSACAQSSVATLLSGRGARWSIEGIRMASGVGIGTSAPSCAATSPLSSRC